jgi:condensin complex subunit 3
LIADGYWERLSPESALLLRMYVRHCKATKDEDRLDDVLPVVTALAFKLEQEHRALSGIVSKLDEQEAVADESLERELAERTFVVKELLTLSTESDFADEIGRRNMFTLIRTSSPPPLSPI